MEEKWVDLEIMGDAMADVEADANWAEFAEEVPDTRPSEADLDAMALASEGGAEVNGEWKFLPC